MGARRRGRARGLRRRILAVEEDGDGERTVLWSTIDAIEELEPEQAWDGQWIPLDSTIGRELIPFDAERRWVGIISNNKDGARLVNYAASGLVEAAALETKTSVVGGSGSDRRLRGVLEDPASAELAVSAARRFKGQRDLGPSSTSRRTPRRCR
jgi:hypothetical protein